MTDGSQIDLPVAKPKPISSCGSASGRADLGKGRKLPYWAIAVRKVGGVGAKQPCSHPGHWEGEGLGSRADSPTACGEYCGEAGVPVQPLMKQIPIYSVRRTP